MRDQRTTTPTPGDCVTIAFMSFRASEARHGIQYFQLVLDTGFRRPDGLDGNFYITTQSPASGGQMTGGVFRPRLRRSKKVKKDGADLNNKRGRVLVVDDEAELMTALCERLAKNNYETAGFTNGAEALESLRNCDYDLLLTDLMMPGMDGIEIIREGLKIDANLICIIMTGQGTVETAVEAMRIGAFDYIMKPFKLSTLLPMLSRAMEMRNLQLENMNLRETVAMHELGQAIAFSSDLNAILNKAIDAALQHCKADEASIMLPTSDGMELVVAVARGGHTEHVGKRMPINEGIAGWVAQNRTPVTLSGKVHDERFKPICPRSDIISAVSIPMLAGGILVGVLNVNVTHNRRPFTLGEMKALNMLVGIVAPILESTRMDIALKSSHDRLKVVFDSIDALVYVVDMNTYEILFINQHGKKTWGNIEGKKCWQTIQTGQSGPCPFCTNENLVNSEGIPTGIISWEFRNTINNNWYKCLDQAIFWIDGRLVRMELAYNITDQKFLEETVLRERTLTDRIMKTSPAGIIVVGTDGTFKFANSRAREIIDLTNEDITHGNNIADLAVTDFDGVPLPMDRRPFVQVMATGNPVYGVRYAIEKPDGQRAFLSVNGAPIFDDTGRICDVVLTIDDITEMKKGEEKLTQSYARLQNTLDGTVRAIAKITEARDPYTAGHQERVAKLSHAIARELNLSQDQIDSIQMAGIVHDIGKIYVPAEILTKPTKLSSIEFSMVKSHADVGYDILKTIEFPYPIADIVHQHHERVNGTGYPNGLKCEKIRMEAKILSVADVVEAMASHRPYRPALGLDAALAEIEQNKGTLYDSDAVDVCVKLFREKGFSFA